MRTLLAVVAVSMFCCGNIPIEGDKCEVRECDPSSETRIMECLDGRFRSFDCAGGCRVDAKGNAFCDPRGSHVGDTCPPELGLLAACGDSGRLLCFSGIWQQLDTCDVAAGDDFALCDTDSNGLGAVCLSCRKTAPAVCSR